MRLVFLLVSVAPLLGGAEYAHAPGIYPADELKDTEVTMPKNPYQRDSWNGYEYYYDKSGLEKPAKHQWNPPTDGGKLKFTNVLEDVDRERGEDPEETPTTTPKGITPSTTIVTPIATNTTTITTIIAPITPITPKLESGLDAIRADGFDFYNGVTAQLGATHTKHHGGSPGAAPPSTNTDADADYQSPYEIEAVTNAPTPKHAIWENTIAPIPPSVGRKSEDKIAPSSIGSGVDIRIAPIAPSTKNPLIAPIAPSTNSTPMALSTKNSEIAPNTPIALSAKDSEIVPSTNNPPIAPSTNNPLIAPSTNGTPNVPSTKDSEIASSTNNPPIAPSTNGTPIVPYINNPPIAPYTKIPRSAQHTKNSEITPTPPNNNNPPPTTPSTDTYTNILYHTNAPMNTPNTQNTDDTKPFAPIAPISPPRMRKTKSIAQFLEIAPIGEAIAPNTKLSPIGDITAPDTNKAFEGDEPRGEQNTHPSSPYGHVSARSTPQSPPPNDDTKEKTKVDIDRIAGEYQISAREFVDYGVQRLGETTKDIIMEESGKDAKLLGRNSKRCCSCCPEGKPALRQVYIKNDPTYPNQPDISSTASADQFEPLTSQTASIDGDAYLPNRGETIVRHPFQEYQPAYQYPQSYPSQAPCGCQQQNCCPPPQPCCLPQIPCCPPIPCCPQPRICCQPVCAPPPTCCTISFQLPTIPICGRACPSCPCRRRVHRARRLKRTITGAGCTQCSAAGEPWKSVQHREKRQTGCGGTPSSGCSQCAASHLRSPRVKRMGCLPCLGRKKRSSSAPAENQHIRVKRMGCLPCLGGRKKRSAPSNCSQCSNMGHLMQRFKRSFFGGCNVCPQTCPCRQKRSIAHQRKLRKRTLTYGEACDSSCCDYSSCKRSKKSSSVLEFWK